MSYFEARSLCSRLDGPWSVERVTAYAQPEQPFYLTSQATVGQRLKEKSSAWLSEFWLDRLKGAPEDVRKQPQDTPSIFRHFGESLKQSVLSQHIAMCKFSPLDFSPICSEVLSPEHPRRQMLEKRDVGKFNSQRNAAHHRWMGRMFRADVGLCLSAAAGCGMRVIATMAWQLVHSPVTIYQALTKTTASLVPTSVVRDSMRGLSLRPVPKDKDEQNRKRDAGLMSQSSATSSQLVAPRPRRGANFGIDTKRPGSVPMPE